MSILCRLKLSMLGRRFILCKFAVALIAFSLIGQATAHPCDVSGDTIDGRCSMFTKTLKVLSKRFEAILEVNQAFVNSLFVDLSFGNCTIKVIIEKTSKNAHFHVVKGYSYNIYLKFEGTESGVKLSGYNSLENSVCPFLEFEPYEKNYRLPFSWSVNNTSFDVTLKFITPVEFVDPINNSNSSLSKGALIGISLATSILIVFVPVGIGIFIYCMCKRRGSNTLNPTDAKPVEIKPSETSKQQHKDSKKQKGAKAAKSVEETKSIETLTPANLAEQHSDKKHLKPERANKDISKRNADARQVENAKSNEVQKQHNPLNEKSRQAACGCQHRIGKLCDNCKAAISKANQASVSLTESQETKTLHDKR